MNSKFYTSFTKNRKGIIFIMLIMTIITLTGCATFYQKTIAIQNSIESGNFESASKQLEKEKKWATNNHRVLYFMNRGVVAFMLGNYAESNKYFDQADFYIEDYSKNFGTEALVLVSNPMVRPYPAEDYEAIMVNYYKALNFIAMNNYEGAIVECRRINIRLQVLNDKYKNHKNKYAKDAFAHNLMGLIYEATGDYNNAFIAYRNALNIYEEDYTTLFGISAPLQLKKDLLYSAQRSGFHSEVDFYENKFNIKTPTYSANEGKLVYIWMNGFAPIKSEWSINLTNMGTKDGFVIFGSSELGVTFPLSMSSKSSSGSFGDLSMVRMAFPKLVERKPYFNSASLVFENKKYPLELSQNINKIAFETLNDRMLRELGNNVVRLATKQLMANATRKQNENLGTIVSIVNAITEKADTRNWQSLPYSISYSKVNLKPGEHTLKLEQRSANGKIKFDNVNVKIVAGKTTFQVFHQLQY